jgi:Cys-tRNA synthase (O-phospho-L-seryl-tRNA:Cys-tRNA synthase)
MEPMFLIDGAQAVAHLEVDVQAIGCDFYVFSAHKMYGPMGTGSVVWSKRSDGDDASLSRRWRDDLKLYPLREPHIMNCLLSLKPELRTLKGSWL